MVKDRGKPVQGGQKKGGQKSAGEKRLSQRLAQIDRLS
jgi:hypothetical protein